MNLVPEMHCRTVTHAKESLGDVTYQRFLGLQRFEVVVDVNDLRDDEIVIDLLPVFDIKAGCDLAPGDVEDLDPVDVPGFVRQEYWLPLHRLLEALNVLGCGDNCKN